VKTLILLNYYCGTCLVVLVVGSKAGFVTILCSFLSFQLNLLATHSGLTLSLREVCFVVSNIIKTYLVFISRFLNPPSLFGLNYKLFII
jgi:hypothetical protein